MWLDGQQFVRVDEALLVEFAVVLSKRLRAQPNSLYYASMDFEEEPIFALSLQGDAFEPSSVWASGAPVVVSTQDAIAAAQHYIDRLSAELKGCGGDLPRRNRCSYRCRLIGSPLSTAHTSATAPSRWESSVND